MAACSEHFTIGSASDNDLQIDNPYISRHHARLNKSLKGIEIEDLGSTNHTFVNGERVSKCQVRIGDKVGISQHWELDWEHSGLKLWIDKPLQDVESQPNSPGHSEGQQWEYDLENTTTSVVRIGRAPGNDLRIEHPRVSREHAVLKRQDGYWVIEDLQSTNGTFVDGKRVRKAALSSERAISIAGLSVSLFPCSAPLSRLGASAGEAEILLDSVSFKVREGSGHKTILQEMTLSIAPGEFVGLIGPSGSGKSTLMNMVNGYNTPSHGMVEINGIDLHKNAQAFHGFVGFVPQDDIIHRELTVEGSLRYSASLRLPRLSTQERKKEVDKVIQSLGLEPVKNVLIGKPEKKGISGGQRKRVNLAQELITQPSILLLDEPCSGLDPQSDHEVMLLLREMSNSGKTVVLTTHNITQRNFELMDKLIVLTTGGHLAYYGPAKEATRYFGVSSPENIFSALKSRDAAFWSQKYLDSPHASNTKLAHSTRDRSELIEPKPVSGNNLSQLGVLCSRFAEMKWRDTLQTFILFAQAPIISLLLALVFGSSDSGDAFPSVMPLFLLVISSIWLGASNATREIVSERAIFQRERKVFLGTGNYILSKLIVLSALCSVQCFILLLFCHDSCEIAGGFLSVYFTLLLVSIAATCMGLMISAFCTSEASAMALIPIVLIPQVVLGGMILKPIHMGEAVKVLAGLMLSRWGFESVLITEEKANAFKGLVSSFGFNASNLGADVVMILFWALLYIIATGSLLNRRR